MNGDFEAGKKLGGLEEKVDYLVEMVAKLEPIINTDHEDIIRFKTGIKIAIWCVASVLPISLIVAWVRHG